MEKEYLSIVDKIINNQKFLKLKNEKHHFTNRYNHSLSVSYLTYKITKKFDLDYKSATRAALLHDFFFGNEFNNKITQMFKHYEKALTNAKKITKLNELEESIISSHMYPVGGTIPKNMESFIVDIVDDYISLKEQLYLNSKRLSQALGTLIIILMNFMIR